MEYLQIHACLESSFHRHKAVFTISSNVLEKKKRSIFIKNNILCEREIFDLANFIYFCFLILNNLSGSSTFCGETTRNGGKKLTHFKV